MAIKPLPPPTWFHAQVWRTNGLQHQDCDHKTTCFINSRVSRCTMMVKTSPHSRPSHLYVPLSTSLCTSYLLLSRTSLQLATSTFVISYSNPSPRFTLIIAFNKAFFNGIHTHVIICIKFILTRGSTFSFPTSFLGFRDLGRLRCLSTAVRCANPLERVTILTIPPQSPCTCSLVRNLPRSSCTAAGWDDVLSLHFSVPCVHIRVLGTRAFKPHNFLPTLLRSLQR